MKTGKVPENVLKRSVLKQIKTKRAEIERGAGIGTDCAFFTCLDQQTSACSIEPISLPADGIVLHAIMAAINNIAAGGAKPVGVLLSILLPEHAREEELKGIMKLAEETCGKLSIQIMGGHTEVTSAVIRPVITAAGVGVLMESDGAAVKIQKARAGQDVVASKWIGLEGTALIAKEQEERLLSKYPPRLIEEAKSFDNFLSIIPEAATAVRSGVCAMHDVRSGGIFGALWELAESADVGLIIDLKKIPIKQETIEICEFMDVNPYELLSGGMLLMTADKGADLVKAFNAEGIEAAVIGVTTENNDRIVINEGETRFLEPPRGDEIYRIL